MLSPIRFLKILVLVLIISITATGISKKSAYAQEKPEIFVQLGHTNWINAVAFSPDGRFVLSGGDDKVIKLWESATGREIRTFRGHKDSVWLLAFSPDSRFVLSGSGDEIILWDVSTGKEIQQLSNGYLMRTVAFSPDGRHILAGGDKGNLKLCDVAIGKEIKTFTGHTDWINSVTFSPDGRFALSGSDDKTLKLWDIATGKEIRTFKGHAIPVTSVIFSSDRRFALSGSHDGVIKLWELSTGKEIKTFKGYSDDIYSIAFSPDGKYALFGNFHGIVKLWDVSTGKEIRTLTGHTSAVHSIVFSSDSRYVLAGGREGIPILWDTATGKELRRFTTRTVSVNSVAFSPDGRHVLSGSRDQTIKLWNITTGRKVKTFEWHRGEVIIGGSVSVAFSPDKRYVLSGVSESIRLWDIATGKEIRVFTGYNSNSSVAFSPDGRHILAGGHKGTVKLWDVATGKEIRTFTGHSETVEAVAFSRDGRYVLSGGYDNTIKLWNANTGEEIKTLTGHLSFGSINHILSVAFSPNGEYALSGSVDNTVKLWDIATGKEIKTLEGHTGCVASVIFSHSGDNILSGSCDGTIKIWNVPTGKEIKTLIGHAGGIPSVAFSHDDKYVISNSADGTIRLWDVATGKELAQFISFEDDEWIVITPEGYFNASPNGAKYLNVIVGNNVYSIDNFYEKFFNPVYVASVLQGRKVEAVADIKKGILTPPDVKIISPEPNATFSTDTITITVSAKDTGGGIDEIRLYHNGKAIGEDVRAAKVVSKAKETIKTYTVTLVDGINTFRAVGFSKDRTESNPYELIVKLTAPSKEVNLYVLAVGINKYKNPALNLNYAEPDAKSIVEFFRQKGEGLFKNVEIIETYNEHATKETIISKLKQLQNTHPQDAVLIYLAGHGENIADKWYFIPHELTYPEREDVVKAKGISSDELSGYIKNISAQKILMLIDACKSGAVLVAFRGFEDRKALSQLSRSTGVHVIAASTKDQFAAEVKDLGHGVFTYTLLEGLKGKASGGGETVTVRKLMGYVEERLPDITKKYKQEAQYPVVDSKGMDFPLVIAK